MTTSPTPVPLPVAIIGGGPVGLAAAAHLLARNETPLVLEAGPAVGASIRAWGHVRLFSPWRYVVDQAAVSLMRSTGWTLPDPERGPTGSEFVQRYLEPLAAVPEVSRVLRPGTRVTAVTRLGHDRLKTPGRAEAPFLLLVQTAAGETELLAKAVIDASGTYTAPNPLGASGVPALGERAARDHITYGIPDVLGRDRPRFAGQRVLVVGSGHSAFNVLLDLATLAESEPTTQVTWAIRRAKLGQLFGGEEQDALPARGSLGTRTRRLVESGQVQLVSLRISAVRPAATRLEVVGDDGSTVGPFDELVATTGFRPDPQLTRELRLDLDPWVEAPRALAPLIDPNVHSCGSVPPHGVDELAHPQEPGFYTVGMKSYGRAPTFLLLTGYEQARSVAAAIAGDWEAARQVQLVLPETGVCSTSVADGGACCAPAPLLSPSALLATAGTFQLPVLTGFPVQSGPVQLATTTATACCDSTEQQTCCGPADKADCCDAAAPGTCGCH